ncbi:unnamed protein product [Rotaria sordida]|uniref:Uncharacterized protein n=1 Tax=Rotaria sordida TaxID=392033 RepID=A0A818V4F3_9BILA|nr:unnamed protein product [Rotaria sordida]
MIHYLIHSFDRRSPLKRSRRRLFYRSLIIIICIFIISPFLILFFHSISIFRLNHSKSHSLNIIVSLTSTPARFDYELPFTIHSLLSQTKLPKQIRIYLSPTSIIIKQKNLTLTHLKMYLQRLDSSKTLAQLFDRLVKIRLEDEDYGPATKFLPIIKEFHSKSQAIMICDDDFYYHPFTIATLHEYSNKFPNSIIGFRGWRVREDLIWGVGGKYEMAYHIIQSHYLSEVYPVSVITANSAYLIHSLFFDAHIHLYFDKIPNDIRHVDDIWLNGQASKRNITRYIIPSCCPHISVTRTHVLEEYFGKNNISRFSANNHALQWFSDNWEKNLWYKFNGENAPKYRNWRTMIYREWISMILNFKFIIYFGFI